MALIFYGTSICPLCNKILQQGEDITGFAAFMPNAADLLYVFNDAGMHTACVKAHTLGQQALEYMNEYVNGGAPAERKCVVTGDTIGSPDDFVFIPMLTSDKNEPLYKYRFTTLNRRHISAWPEREFVLRELRKFKVSDKWQQLPGNPDFIAGLERTLAL